MVLTPNDKEYFNAKGQPARLQKSQSEKGKRSNSNHARKPKPEPKCQETFYSKWRCMMIFLKLPAALRAAGSFVVLVLLFQRTYDKLALFQHTNAMVVIV